MAKSFREDIRNQMFKDISQYNSKDPDSSSYQPQAYSDALKISNEIGESKSAKNKFRKDLQSDPDYNEFKKRARYRDEYSKDDFEYGTPNAMDNDPFIKKDKYQRVGKDEELDEKWSEKYKNSIDCNNPKGFSQKAHCQGKKKKENNEAASAGGSTGAFVGPIAFKDSKFLRNSLKKETKKVETKEATSSSSTGSYSQPSIWAKSMSKKNFRGYDKPVIPGGKFVTVKKKCKKYPYCNQGDIKALKIFENEVVKNVIKNLAKKHNLSESYVKFIIQNQMGNK
jgi:hypothetical protein